MTSVREPNYAPFTEYSTILCKLVEKNVSSVLERLSRRIFKGIFHIKGSGTLRGTS